MKFKNLILIIIILGVFTTYIFHRSSFLYPVEKTEILMDTVVTIKVYGKNRNYAEDIVDKAFENMRAMEIILNNYDNRSDIYKINVNSGIQPVKVSDITIRFLKKAVALCKETDGYLDITIGKILDLWGFATKHPKIPDKNELKKALKLKGLQYIKINDKTNEVYISEKGVWIDVGAVAKGFIIDETIDFIKGKAEKAIVNAGGDIKFLGFKDKGVLWKIGIKNPFSSSENDIIKTVKVGNWAVVTSGDYERFFIKNGKRYHHIINPFTGFPSNFVHSVTVCCNSAFLADGLATGIFVMGDKIFFRKYYKKFKKLQHFRVIIIKNRNEIIDSGSLKFKVQGSK